MLNAPSNPTLIYYVSGQPKGTFPIREGITSIGRAPDNTIVFDDDSVSRRHAEIELRRDDILIRDLGSRNGIFHNRVQRKSASLHPGDLIRIGKVELQFASGFVRPITPPARKIEEGDNPAELATTKGFRQALPESRQDRHLAALYHLCFRATEGADVANTGQQFLDLLLDGLRAQVAQFYTPAGELAFKSIAEKSKDIPKFASYLLKKFQHLTESRPYTGAELGKLQQKMSGWHYLVAPLRTLPTGDDGSIAIVVFLRSSEWQEFSAEDRTLLNAAARLWPASQGAAAAPSTPPVSVTGSQPPMPISAANTRTVDNVKAPRPTKRTTPPIPVQNAFGLLGSSPVLQQLRARLDKISATKVTVLVTGETGSGKEVVARYLHDHSPRAKAPFVSVNCTAISESLMEAELFGHTKDAFTGATENKDGKFQLAQGGTIFLDEIGDLPLGLQPKLLRVLDIGEAQKVGEGISKKVDVRIVAATHQDLRALVRKGRFREDLFYRLMVVSVVAPPLREHSEDVPILARHFLTLFCSENGIPPLDFAPEALATLQSHPWPGNVRLLRNIVQRVATEAAGPQITAADIQFALSQEPSEKNEAGV